MRHQNGFTILETLVVVGLTAVITAISVPLMGNLLGFARLSGDARSVNNAVALAKMRAAATFSRARVFVDLSGNSFHIETWQKTGTPGWVTEAGSVALSTNDTFGFGVVASAPPSTQTTISQAPACTDNSGNAIGNTACVMFNSRGIPIDSTGAPTALGAFYLTDTTAVYGTTVSATGMTRLWKTTPTSTPSWILQ